MRRIIISEGENSRVKLLCTGTERAAIGATMETTRGENGVFHGFWQDNLGVENSGFLVRVCVYVGDRGGGWTRRREISTIEQTKTTPWRNVFGNGLKER